MRSEDCTACNMHLEACDRGRTCVRACARVRDCVHLLPGGVRLDGY